MNVTGVLRFQRFNLREELKTQIWVRNNFVIKISGEKHLSFILKSQIKFNPAVSAVFQSLKVDK